MPVERLRRITFGHVEADEYRAMNLFLAAVPRAQVAHGLVGCLVSIGDLADRQPRRLADGEVITLGGRRVRHLDTPHNREARVLYEETTGVLFCGDLMTRLGTGPALTSSDLVQQAEVAAAAPVLVFACTCKRVFGTTADFFNRRRRAQSQLTPPV
ncbi:hypothetical protein ACWEKR_10375 [Nocardia sp. NPDC004573]